MAIFLLVYLDCLCNFVKLLWLRVQATLVDILHIEFRVLDGRFVCSIYLRSMVDRTDAEMISGLVTYLEGIRHCGPVICELC